MGVSPLPYTVGYAQSGLKSGGTLVTPQFAAVSGGTYSLSDLVATGDDIVDNVEVQTLDAYGRTVNSYIWVDYLSENPCWMDNDTFEEATANISAGQGLWIFGSTAEQAVQSAGKVETSDVAVALINGASAVGNPYPVSVSIQDVIAVGDDIVDNVEIQTLDAYGRTINSYIWVDYLSENPCWMDNDTFEEAEATISGGQALWVFGTSSEQTIRFPAPEL